MYPNVRLITQNVDRLHLKSGVDPKRLVEVHGAVGLYRCSKSFVPLYPHPLSVYTTCMSKYSLYISKINTLATPSTVAEHVCMREHSTSRTCSSRRTRTAT